MRKIKAASIILSCGTTILFSCNSQPTAGKINGKWSIDNIERIDGGDTSNIANERKEVRAVSIYFNKDGSCYSTKTKVDTLGTGKFEVVNNGKFIVLHMNGETRPDTLEIQEMTADMI